MPQSTLVDSKNFLNSKKALIIPPLICENRLHRTNHLISTNQSGFKSGDSSISHLLSITHGINESFDKENKLKVCFLTDQKHLIRFAIKVSSKSKILRENFEELGLEFLQHKWWYKKPCAFYKILKKIISKRSF